MRTYEKVVVHNDKEQSICETLSFSRGMFSHEQNTKHPHSNPFTRSNFGPIEGEMSTHTERLWSIRRCSTYENVVAHTDTKNPIQEDARHTKRFSCPHRHKQSYIRRYTHIRKRSSPTPKRTNPCVNHRHFFGWTTS